MADTLYLEIVTPERVLYQGDVKNITAPGAYGEFMVLPDHAPFFTSLEIGRLQFQTESGQQWAAVHGGYFEVLDNRVTVLSNRAELAHEIDVERAMRAKARAEARLQDWHDRSQDDKDLLRARAALSRAMAREEVHRMAPK
jgi:F-type H+-transporting ATPase subunit epsilon